jgi:hypothetical protein
MNTKTVANKNPPSTQEICIDLPGESVRCWRSADHVKVILRKHRDVFFDISIKDGATYTIESTSDYYSPREKKLQRKSQFQDGERFHLWVGRKFKGTLILKAGNTVIGSFEPNKLDANDYDADPKTKPEPLMVILGKKISPSAFVCNMNDPYGAVEAQRNIKPMFDPKLTVLSGYGTRFDYQLTLLPPEINEYVSITEANSDQIQSQVIKQLESGVAVEGKATEIFVAPEKGQETSDLYVAMAAAAKYIDGNKVINDNAFKESIGYLLEHWRSLDKITMTVRLEKRVAGKYRVIFKGRPLSKVVSQVFRGTGSAAIAHQSAIVGSEKSAFLDGGFSRTGRSGFGGARRIFLTVTENFRAGMKIQAIGTIIDIIGDANDVYFDEKGSKDLSEFIGRAGVTLVEAGATAVIGSALSAVMTALILGAVGSAGLPVVIAVAIAILGFNIGAMIVSGIDDEFNIKENVAGWVK